MWTLTAATSALKREPDYLDKPKMDSPIEIPEATAKEKQKRYECSSQKKTLRITYFLSKTLSIKYATHQKWALIHLVNISQLLLDYPEQILHKALKTTAQKKSL